MFQNKTFPYLMKINQNPDFNQAYAISPIDGRYAAKLKILSSYCSEYALFHYRIKVELAYLAYLSKFKFLRQLKKNDHTSINRLIEVYDIDDFNQIKNIEKKINHDVKAVEYYLVDKLATTSLKDLTNFVHFGLTSEDTNNLAYGLMFQDIKNKVLLPFLKQFILDLKILAKENKNSVFLARTHGQPAIPTTFTKEIVNYIVRLDKQYKRIQAFVFEGKCNGAVGNYSGFYFIDPKINWIKLTDELIASFGLKPNHYTTQILPYDNWIEFFQIIKLVNGIIYDLSINLWQYIMLGIIKQKDQTTVGSSTMPQKINPIDFENAEGNSQLANSQIEFYESKLIHSRLQRDLSDSTVRRSFGATIGYSLLSWQSCSNGLKKISIDEDYCQNELDNHWEILAEPLQLFIKHNDKKKAYELLKSLTQGKKISRTKFRKIITLISKKYKLPLKEISPEKYTGAIKELVKQIINY